MLCRGHCCQDWKWQASCTFQQEAQCEGLAGEVKLQDDDTLSCTGTGACASGEADGSRHGSTRLKGCAMPATWAKMTDIIGPPGGLPPR